jgi:hypothetical protein
VKHELYYDDEKQIVVFRTRGAFTYEEGVEAVDMLEKIVKGKENVHVLCDTTDFPAKLDKSVRRLQEDLPKRMKISRMAVIATNPAVRMIGRIVVATMGKGFTAGFFKTEDEALRWLKGG